MSVLDSNIKPANQQTSAKANTTYNIGNDIANAIGGINTIQSGKTGFERAQGLGQLITSIMALT